MIDIKSKVEDGKVLHCIHRGFDTKNERSELVSAENFIQCARLLMHKGRTFKPHRHIWKAPNYDKVIAQESWVVIKGSVKAIFYDLDGEYLESHVLYPGDCSFTLEGGHTYEILENSTMVYEFKTGPYEGQERDKEFL
tara:strand:+ start:300 stop:713 length:414 start_codon:yes stop_codon:yes gene_type:complete